jgi:hypothetical protein
VVFQSEYLINERHSADHARHERSTYSHAHAALSTCLRVQWAASSPHACVVCSQTNKAKERERKSCVFAGDIHPRWQRSSVLFHDLRSHQMSVPQARSVAASPDPPHPNRTVSLIETLDDLDTDRNVRQPPPLPLPVAQKALEAVRTAVQASDPTLNEPNQYGWTPLRWVISRLPEAEATQVWRSSLLLTRLHPSISRYPCFNCSFVKHILIMCNTHVFLRSVEALFSNYE